MRKGPLGVLEIKTTIAETKISSVRLSSRLNAEKYRSTEITQTETQKEQKSVVGGPD